MLGFDWRMWSLTKLRHVSRVRGSARRRDVRKTVEMLEERTLLSFSTPVISNYPSLTGFLAHEATGDFNGDGKIDIATLTDSQLGEPVELTVLQGNGDGTFQAQTPISLKDVSNFGSFSMAVGHMNGDGTDDLVLLNGGFELKVFFGSANGLTANNNSTTALSIDDGTFISNPGGALVLGHFERKDRLDVAILPQASNVMRLMVNNGDGTFTENPFPLASPNNLPVDLNTNHQSFDEANTAAVGDLNRDGFDDAIFAVGSLGENPSKQAGILTIKKTSNPDGFQVTSLTPDSQGQDLQAGDLNGDGLLDLAITSQDGTGGVRLFQGQADGSFQAFSASPFFDGNPPSAISSVTFGALVSGPALDLAFNPTDGISGANPGDQSFVFGITTGQGDGTFSTLTFADRNPNGSDENFITEAGRLLVADVDGDGTQDLINVYQNFGQGRTSVLLNTGGTHTTLDFPGLADGSPITITASVTKNSITMPGDPTGTVTFMEGSTVLGQATIVNGVATSDEIPLDAGPHIIKAIYNGDETFLSSVVTSQSINVIINPGRTKTTLTFPDQIEGQTTVQANITKYFPNTQGVIDGTLTFMEGTQAIGQANVVNGQAVSNLDLAPGNHTIRAVYSGSLNGTFTTTTSKFFQVTVTPAPLPDLGLLHIETDGGVPTFNHANKHFEYSGVIHIGLSQAPFQSLLDLSGSISIGTDSIIEHGVVTAHVGAFSAVLFDGTFQFNIGQAETLPFQAPSLPNSLKLGGLGIDFHQLELVQGGINFGGQVQFPLTLGGHVLDISLNQGFHIDTNGVSSHFGGGISLQNLDFNLAGLGIQASDLAVHYDAITDTWLIQGKLVLPDLFGGFISGTTINLAGPNAITIHDGQVNVAGALIINRVDLIPGFWTLRDLHLTINTSQNTFEGSGSMDFPGGIGLRADVGLIGGQLDKVELGLDLPNVPTGIPGVVLTQIDGGVSGITKGQLVYDGHLRFETSPDIDFKLPGFLGGTEYKLSLISLDLNAHIDPSELTATGTVNLLKGVKDSGQDPASATTVTIDWSKMTLVIQTQLHLIDNIVDVSAELHADGKLDLSFNGSAAVNSPAFDFGILHIKSIPLASGKIDFNFTNDGNYANDYISLTGTIDILGIPHNFHLKLDFTGHFVGPFADPVGQTINIPANSGMFLLTATWENDGGNVPVEVVDPNGRVYTEADFDNTSIGVVDTLSDATSKTVGLINPIPGDWTLRIPDETGLGQIQMHGFHDI
ncbi:MAG: hypothetical protein JWM11_7631, partial [Planctomycetaceae bacterium]|nr:hypothetical protein [Planctomycetaceae bacterium]